MICIIVITSFYLFIFDCFDTSFDIKVLYDIVCRIFHKISFLNSGDETFILLASFTVFLCI